MEDPSWMTLPVLGTLFMASFTHFLYNQASFLVLQRFAALSHSIANVMRRFVLIMGATIYFSQPLTQMNVVGIGEWVGVL